MEILPYLPTVPHTAQFDLIPRLRHSWNAYMRLSNGIEGFLQAIKQETIYLYHGGIYQIPICKLHSPSALSIELNGALLDYNAEVVFYSKMFGGVRSGTIFNFKSWISERPIFMRVYDLFQEEELGFEAINNNQIILVEGLDERSEETEIIGNGTRISPFKRHRAHSIAGVWEVRKSS